MHATSVANQTVCNGLTDPLPLRHPGGPTGEFLALVHEPGPARSTPSERMIEPRTAANPASEAHPGSILSWVLLVRPKQWVKNAFVLAALLFSGRALERDAQVQALVAFAAFCFLASSVYVLNDVVDRDSDRAHPTKRNRPIAAGTVSSGAALSVGLLLAIVGLAASFSVNRTVGIVAISYLSLNVLYSLYLKRIVILDVFSISAFFVLRLVAGAAAVDVHASVWLLLCGGLLSLYLGFAKRRHEIVLLGDDSSDHRSVLKHYSTGFLDQLSSVILGVTVVCYIMYSRDSDTARAVGSDALTYSTVFVLYGVVRYLYLVHTKADGNPTDTLLTDRNLLLAVVLWALYCGLIIYRPF